MTTNKIECPLIGNSKLPLDYNPIQDAMKIYLSTRSHTTDKRGCYKLPISGKTKSGNPIAEIRIYHPVLKPGQWLQNLTKSSHLEMSVNKKLLTAPDTKTTCPKLSKLLMISYGDGFYPLLADYVKLECEAIIVMLFPPKATLMKEINILTMQSTAYMTVFFHDVVIDTDDTIDENTPRESVPLISDVNTQIYNAPTFYATWHPTWMNTLLAV